jgi:hypothetical protein
MFATIHYLIQYVVQYTAPGKRIQTKNRGTQTELSNNYNLFQTFRNCSQTLHIGNRQRLRTLTYAPEKKHYSWSLTDDAT